MVSINILTYTNSDHPKARIDDTKSQNEMGALFHNQFPRSNNSLS